jgi:hypothetical protein
MTTILIILLVVLLFGGGGFMAEGVGGEVSDIRMDEAGKDGALRHVMSGVNPQGCRYGAVTGPGQRRRRIGRPVSLPALCWPARGHRQSS